MADLALYGFLVHVEHSMPAKVRGVTEGLATGQAFKALPAGHHLEVVNQVVELEERLALVVVHLQVLVQELTISETHLTELTTELLQVERFRGTSALIVVLAIMMLQIPRRRETFAAVPAFERQLPGVHTLVNCQIELASESLTACVTKKLLFGVPNLSMHLHMNFIIGHSLELLVTNLALHRGGGFLGVCHLVHV